MSAIRNVLVAGGGVGGLSCALAFAQRGVEVTLVERQPDFNVPGVGLGQPANALRVYEKLGLLADVLDAGYIYGHMNIFDADRRLIAAHKFQLGDERVPPVCALRRSDLHRILLGAAERAGVKVKLGCQATAIDGAAGDRVDVGLSDGSRETFDLMAGFDGIRSTTRLHVAGTMFRPKPCGIGGWRIQVPRVPEVTGMEFMQGLGGKAGAMPITKDLMYLFNIRPEPVDAFYDRTMFADMLKERLAQFGGYVAEISASLNATSDIVYSPIEPMLVPWPWHRGRVVIGGDAAHIVPPHLTQGAAMAVEDGLILALEMTETKGSVEDRLTRYAQRRYARCAFVYAFARQWLDDEQNIHTTEQMDVAREEMRLNASKRIAVSDRILNSPAF